MKGLLGQIAVITGAASGIGRGIAWQLAQDGASVAINDIQNPHQVEPLLDQMHQLGVHAIYVPGDVSQREDVEHLLDVVRRELGDPTILVSNAITSERHSLLDTSVEEFVKAVEVGIYGAFHVMQLFARNMVAQKTPGSIIQLTSPWAYMPYPGGLDYRVVKAAQHQMALSAATELMRHRIRVNLVEPGWVDTAGEHRWFSDETLQKKGEQLPFGRLCSPMDVARAVSYLCQEPYITGAHLKVDGGLGLVRFEESADVPHHDD